MLWQESQVFSVNPESEKEILQQLLCLKSMMTELNTKLEERQYRCNAHENMLSENTRSISVLEDKMAGLKAWIATAGVLGGVIGWLMHILPWR